MTEYGSIMKDQIERRTVEVVNEETKPDLVYCIPHHTVIRRDKSTTGLRIVHDVSAKSDGASLNDCLHTGPALTQSTFDIMLRFRNHRVALAEDRGKAFWMVHMNETVKEILRFPCFDVIDKAEPKVITLTLNRVVFGLSSIPFHWMPIKHHIQRYE